MADMSIKLEVAPEDRELFILLTALAGTDDAKAIRGGLMDHKTQMQAITAFRINAITTATQKGLYKSVLTHNLIDNPIKGERFDFFAANPQDAIEIATREARQTGYPRVLITGPLGDEIYRGSAAP